MPSLAPKESAAAPFSWRVHLLRRAPERLPLLLLLLLMAVGCVWLLFGILAPAVVALALLVGATGEYLFPIRYRITAEGVAADSLTGRMRLQWTEARRCLPGHSGVLLTPLPTPSRLDAFRGVLLRFAPPGEPGDRASVLAAIAIYAPELMTDSNGYPEPPGGTMVSDRRISEIRVSDCMGDSRG